VIEAIGGAGGFDVLDIIVWAATTKKKEKKKRKEKGFYSTFAECSTIVLD
jgi:hypothetical protein